jgi:hypothetical protein
MAVWFALSPGATATGAAGDAATGESMQAATLPHAGSSMLIGSTREYSVFQK